MPRRLNLKRLQQTDKDCIWHPFTQMKEWSQQSPLILSRGQGSYVFDLDGNQYLDGTASIWVNIHGHRQPQIDRAIRSQLTKVGHTTLLGASNPPAIQLAQALVHLAPRGLTKVFYSDNGSTAVEIAAKMAIQYWKQCPHPQPQKTRFVHVGLSYHGDTVGALSLSGIEGFRRPFLSLVFPTDDIDSPHCYRCPLSLTFPDCRMACLSPLEILLQEHHQSIAGLIIEPMVQAVAGILPSPPGYLRAVRELCTRYQILMIADEVATGFGRTGKMFACEHEEVTPDLLAIAKGMTGGYLPLAATLATERIYEAFWGEPEEGLTFFHGHSYTGNPLGCAAALANLEVFKRQRTLQKMKKRIPWLRDRLQSFRHDPWVGDIRQCGYMIGIELVADRDSQRPFPLTDRIGSQVAKHAKTLGLLIRPIRDVLILMPPLSASLKELQQMLDILALAIALTRTSHATQSQPA